MRNYEAVLIFAPNLEEEAREAINTKINNVITEKGEIVNVDEWGMRKLAYEINDFREGYYTVVEFKSETEVVKEIERICQISDGVLRCMVVRND